MFSDDSRPVFESWRSSKCCLTRSIESGNHFKTSDLVMFRIGNSASLAMHKVDWLCSTSSAFMRPLPGHRLFNDLLGA